MCPQARHANANADADADTWQTNVKLDDGPPKVGAVIILPNTANRTRGHSQKLYKRKHRLHIRKHNFTFRVVDPWNSLPEMVVSAPTINTFERRLDSFWHNQELKYDFKKCLRITIPNNAPGIAVDDDEHDEPEEN